MTRACLAERGVRIVRVPSLLRLVLLCSALFCSVLCGHPLEARAHPLDSASLSLTEVSQGRYLVEFSAGSRTLQEMSQPVVYPPSCQAEGSFLQCDERGLFGTLRFPWLEGSRMHLMVSIVRRDGQRTVRLVSSDSSESGASELRVYDAGGTSLAAWMSVSRDYCLLGVEHILSGIDHLFFVILLTFLVQGRARLLATVTAFTLAHSLTLAGAALGWASAPILPVEALIALSIVLVAGECLRPQKSLTRRAPWLMAFAFGLLHGLGFASALREIGLPQSHLPSALLSFNLGVELGQLGVIALVLLVGAWGGLALRRLEKNAVFPHAVTPQTVVVYCLGSWAAFWTLERIAAVFSA